jgi:uncharacterized protein
LAITFVAVGAGVQACAGIGISMVAAPVLVAIEPDLLPGPMLLLGAGVNIRNAVMDRADLDATILRRSLGASPIGLLTGFLLLAVLSDGSLAIAVSLFVIGAGLLQVIGRRPPDNAAAHYAAGAGTAFSSIAAALPGPVFAVFHGHRPPAMIRSTLASFMMAITVVAMTILIAQGKFGGRELGLTALLMPGVGLGFPLGAFLRPRVAGPRFARVILGLAVTSAVVVLVKQLVS